jgi:hypothetical protein
MLIESLAFHNINPHLKKGIRNFVACASFKQQGHQIYKRIERTIDIGYWTSVIEKPCHENLITGKEEVESDVGDTG